MIKQICNEQYSIKILQMIIESYNNELLVGTIYETESCIPIIAKGIAAGQYYAYQENNEILGFIQVKQVENRCFLNHIVVSHKYKSEGIGRKLFDYFIFLGQVGAYKEIALSVDSRNHMAVEWYKSQGLNMHSKIYKFIYDPLINKEVLSPTSNLIINLCESDIGYSYVVIDNKNWKIPSPSPKYLVVDLEYFPEKWLRDLHIALNDREIICTTKNRINGKMSHRWDVILMVKQMNMNESY